jgi:hypothetical protein
LRQTCPVRARVKQSEAAHCLRGRYDDAACDKTTEAVPEEVHRLASGDSSGHDLQILGEQLH